MVATEPLRPAEELVGILGQSVWSEKIDGRTMRQVTILLEPAELEKLTERSMELEVVLRPGKSPLLIRKTNYDEEESLRRCTHRIRIIRVRDGRERGDRWRGLFRLN